MSQSNKTQSLPADTRLALCEDRGKRNESHQKQTAADVRDLLERVRELEAWRQTHEALQEREQHDREREEKRQERERDRSVTTYVGEPPAYLRHAKPVGLTVGGGSVIGAIVWAILEWLKNGG